MSIPFSKSSFISTVFTIFLLFVSYLIVIGHEPYILQNANVVIHEAGHTILGFFGEFTQFLGGTIFQILFPSLFIFYFFKQSELFSASIVIWWLGVNLFEIGTYAADAQTQLLPLIGGEHDWAYILGHLNMLQQSLFVGKIFHIAGIVAMFVPLFFILFLGVNTYFLERFEYKERK
jgi:hypothetical protein